MAKKQMLILVLLSLLLLSLNSVAAESGSLNGCIYYFYGIDCTHCEQTDTYIQQLTLKNPNLDVRSFEVYYDQDNYKLLKKYAEIHSLPESSVGVPMVLTSAGYFIGDKGILSFLENNLQENPGMLCPVLDSTELVGVVGEKSPSDLQDTLTFFAVTRGAVKHSFTPGALAFIMILLVVLISAKDLDDATRKSVLTLIGVFAAIFLFGMGYLSWFGVHANVSSFFSKFVGLGGVIVGFVGISRFFTPWRAVARHIPASFTKNSSWLFETIFSQAGSLIVGFVAALFSLANAGRVLLSIRVLITDSTSRSASVPLLIFYALVFLALAIIVAVVYYLTWKALKELALKKGEFSDRDKKLWSNHMLKLFRWGLSIIAFVLGIILLFF